MQSELDGITVHYEEHGQGQPLLVLPGWGASGALMAHSMESAFRHRPGWRRIYPDLPGHGRTPGAAWITDQDKILEVVLAFLDKVIAGERFALYGASLGAYLARGVLYHRAEAVDGLALIVPVILAEDERRSVPDHAVVARDSDAVAELGPDEQEMLDLLVVHTRPVFDQFRVAAKLVADKPGDPDFLEAIRQDPGKYACSFDVDARSEPFPAPTLIVAGRQDSIVGYRDAWSLLDNFPRATYVVLDRAGHFTEEKEGLINILMADWLDRVEEYANHRPA